MKRWGVFVDGKWQEPLRGEHGDVVNPATNEVIARTARSDVDDVERAVSAARRAFEGTWGRATPRDRAAALRPPARA